MREEIAPPAALDEVSVGSDGPRISCVASTATTWIEIRYSSNVTYLRYYATYRKLHENMTRE